MWEYVLILGLAVLVMVGFAWGKKKNLSLAQQTASILEKVFNSKDQSYIWIGGFIGFKAVYETEKWNKIKASVLFLPRHAILYFPFSKLIKRYDRIYITAFFRHNLPGEIYLIHPRLKGEIKQREKTDLKKSTVPGKKHSFVLFYSSHWENKIERFREFAGKWECEQVAVNGEDKTLFLQTRLNPSILGDLVQDWMTLATASSPEKSDIN